MSQTVILGTARTPFGKMGGALASKNARELGGEAITAALERAEVAADQVQQVIFGQVLQAGQGQIPSKIIGSQDTPADRETSIHHP